MVSVCREPESFSLSWGERAGVRASLVLPVNSVIHSFIMNRILSWLAAATLLILTGCSAPNSPPPPPFLPPVHGSGPSAKPVEQSAHADNPRSKLQLNTRLTTSLSHTV